MSSTQSACEKETSLFCLWERGQESGEKRRERGRQEEPELEQENWVLSGERQ